MLTRDDVNQEIITAEAALDPQRMRLWRAVRVPPQKWNLAQYSPHEHAWVVAVLGQRCLYLNEVEEGWGWGSYVVHGTVGEFHCQQDKLQHAVSEAMWFIREHGFGSR